MTTKYVPIAGTHAWGDGWITDESPFAAMMRAEGFEPLRSGDRPFRWSTALDGLLGEDHDWQAAADALYWFLRPIPVGDRNIIAHSHGGQVALLLASSGVPLRSLTTVGTPCRDDIPVAIAEHAIGFHQHLYDLRRDWWGWFGAIGDHELSLRRSFADPHVVNLPVKDIRHAKILRDPQYIPLWRSQGWLWNIRAAAAVQGVYA